MRSPHGAIETIICTRSSSTEHSCASRDQETVVREHLDHLGIPHDRARVINDATSARMARRLGYEQIVEMCDQGKAILLAVYDLTRLGRTDAVTGLIGRIVDSGGNVITVKGAVDTSQPGWEGVFEYMIERRAHYAYLRGRRGVGDE